MPLPLSPFARLGRETLHAGVDHAADSFGLCSQALLEPIVMNGLSGLSRHVHHFSDRVLDVLRARHVSTHDTI